MTNLMTKSEKKRQSILSGNLWKVIASLALPLVFYNLCNYLYGIYDMIIVGKAQIGSVASVVVLDQIKNMISTLGSSLAAGGAIIIARKYGAGDIDGARKSANTLFTISGLIAISTLLIFIPFGIPFLKLIGTSKDIIDSSMGYFYVQILSLAVQTINITFIALEKSKGNTSKLFTLNLIVVFVKITLTTFFAFGPLQGMGINVNMTWIAGATVIAQSIMLVFGMFTMFSRNNILGIKIKLLNLDKDIIQPILMVSLPIFFGRFLFSFGKVFINNQVSNFYGDDCVGVLGISNVAAGLFVNITNSFEETESTIVSQNVGNKNGKRTIETFKKTAIITSSIGLFGTILITIFLKEISFFFGGNDGLKEKMIQNVLKFEMLDLIMFGMQNAAFGLLYGYSKTRLTMSISMAQLFLLRIPSLLILYHVFQIGYEASGMAMLISNGLSGIIAFAIALIFIKKAPNNYQNIF